MGNESTSVEPLSKSIMKSTGFLFLGAASLCLLAITGSTLWEWFLVPLGLPIITPVHAYGLTLVATLPLTWLIISLYIKDNEKLSLNGKQVATAIGSCLAYLFYLGIGYVCHLLM